MTESMDSYESWLTEHLLQSPVGRVIMEPLCPHPGDKVVLRKAMLLIRLASKVKQP
jgi:hypothetical protein